jgi:lipase chaperone LimK
VVGEPKEVPEEVTKLREAVAAFAAIEDDAACTAAVSEALRDWPDLGAELRKLREQRVKALRQQRTWPEIAEIIGGVTPERAQQISKGLSGAEGSSPES